MHQTSLATVSLELEPLEDRRVLSTASFVTGLYTNLLNRSPQPAEVSNWVSVIDTGAASPQQIALTFVTSTEYRSNLIQADYQHLLGRAPSVQETNGWLAALQQGLSQQQLVAGFVSSAEFVQGHGGTNPSWITGVYQSVLGRAPDPAGQAFWIQALANGSSRQAVAQSIINNPEALARLVTAAYRDVLGRVPDPQGLAAATVALDNGLSPEALLAMLASSPEFINARGGLDAIQPVPVPVFVPVDTFVFNPFLGGPEFGFGTTTGGFSGGGFSSGGSFSGTGF